MFLHHSGPAREGVFNQNMMNHLTQAYLNRIQQQQAQTAAKARDQTQPLAPSLSSATTPIPERSADGKTLKVGSLTITELDD